MVTLPVKFGHTGCQAELMTERAAREKMEGRMAEVERNAKRCEELRRTFRHCRLEHEQLERFLNEEAER